MSEYPKSVNGSEDEPKIEPSEVSTNVAKLIARTGEILERARQRATEVLKSFTELALEENQAFACFELFHTQDYALDYNKFYVKQGSLEPDSIPVSNDAGSFIPELNDFMEEYFSNDPDVLSEKDESEFVERHEEQLVKWFSTCWFAAGGKDSHVPTYLALDKEYRVRDLATGEIMDEKEAAHRLGFIV